MQVLDARDSTFLDGAHIYDSVSSKGYISNKEGWVLRPEFEGNWLISHLGYRSVHLKSFEGVQRIYLEVEPRHLHEVQVFGINLREIIQRNLQAMSSSTEELNRQKEFTLRIVSRKNKELSQLVQVQLKLRNRKLYLCGVDYSKTPKRDQGLSAAGYLDLNELIKRGQRAYPLTYLDRFLNRYDIHQITNDGKSSHIHFSGELRDTYGRRLPIKKATLVIDRENKFVQSLEWTIEYGGLFENYKSRRHQKQYALAYKKKKERFVYTSDNAGIPRLMDSFTSYDLRVKQGARLDTVQLSNRLLFPSSAVTRIVGKRRSKRLRIHKSILDQLNDVPLKKNNFLLTAEEVQFLNSHDY